MKARLNNIEINYEMHGDGPPLVLAHGYTATLDMWREQVPALSAKYRLVIYDTRGHGATTAPADMDAYDMVRGYVADQAALIDHLGIDRAYVGGLSMGGMIAQEFALRHPERVRALLLFDTGPGMGAMRDPARATQFAQMREMMQALARTKGMAAIVDAMRNSPMTFRPAAGAAIPDAARRHVENMRRMSVDGYLGGSKAMQDWAGTLGRLGSITAPTLVLAGESDSLLPASRAIHREIAGSRFVLLKGAGHGTNIWR
ncbi:MAG TPA: alpha/beta fold hydrolase, partial [Dehalococcoidia bacterium]|nr:alpha/beta fold hydrolase [Dehalococcoidia bacterium]